MIINFSHEYSQSEFYDLIKSNNPIEKIIIPVMYATWFVEITRLWHDKEFLKTGKSKWFGIDIEVY
jgi:hypothetical protein